MNGEKQFELSVSVTITSNQGDRLYVSEQVTIKDCDFLEMMAKVLGRFHDLAIELRGK